MAKELKRRWEILIIPYPRFWHFWLWKAHGGKHGGKPFLHSISLGPVEFRLWASPQSVHSVHHAIFVVRIDR